MAFQISSFAHGWLSTIGPAYQSKGVVEIPPDWLKALLGYLEDVKKEAVIRSPLDLIVDVADKFPGLDTFLLTKQGTEHWCTQEWVTQLGSFPSQMHASTRGGTDLHTNDPSTNTPKMCEDWFAGLVHKPVQLTWLAEYVMQDPTLEKKQLCCAVFRRCMYYVYQPQMMSTTVYGVPTWEDLGLAFKTIKNAHFKRSTDIYPVFPTGNEKSPREVLEVPRLQTGLEEATWMICNLSWFQTKFPPTAWACFGSMVPQAVIWTETPKDIVIAAFDLVELPFNRHMNARPRPRDGVHVGNSQEDAIDVDDDDVDESEPSMAPVDTLPPHEYVITTSTDVPSYLADSVILRRELDINRHATQLLREASAAGSQGLPDQWPALNRRRTDLSEADSLQGIRGDVGQMRIDRSEEMDD